MVENQLIVDGSTCKQPTSNHPAFALLLLAGMLLLLALAFLPQPALAATPITTCTELQNIRNNLNGDYYLANDITAPALPAGTVEQALGRLELKAADSPAPLTARAIR